jgi:hypothetical protein
MQKRKIIYTILPVVAIALMGGTGIASASGWFGGFGALDPEQAAQKHQEQFQRQAELLGISVEAVKEGWSDGKGIKELAEENGITEEQLQEKFKEQRQTQMQAKIQAMVDQGIISQDQANRRLQFMEENGGNGFGKMGRYGFGRGLCR